ncbi:hypothetical protein QQP08_006481 [Theobroma cacao]|nr:hypothetical protein QQP08_006481 [Theobroma cacao]
MLANLEAFAAGSRGVVVVEQLNNVHLSEPDQKKHKPASRHQQLQFEDQSREPQRRMCSWMFGCKPCPQALLGCCRWLQGRGGDVTQERD